MCYCGFSIPMNHPYMVIQVFVLLHFSTLFPHHTHTHTQRERERERNFGHLQTILVIWTELNIPQILHRAV